MPPARNPSNQGILDYLTTLSQHEKFNKPSSHYPFIFQKALKNIADETTPITTYEQAKKIKNVGSFLASQIARFFEQQKQELAIPPNQQEQVKDDQTRQRLQSKKRSAGTTTTNDGSNSSIKANKHNKHGFVNEYDIEDDDCHTISCENPGAFGVIPTPAQAAELLKRTGKLTKNGVSMSSSSTVTPTEILLQKAIQMSNHLSSSVTQQGCSYTTILSENYTNFTLVLLLDSREYKSDQVQSRLLQKGISCEQRSLPIGDMLWIARGYRKHNMGSNASSRVIPGELTLPETVEIVLDTIIERKTLEDLMSSLYGTRWNEQRLRLKQHTVNTTSNSVGSEGDQPRYDQQPQVIYLIESSSSAQQDHRKPIHGNSNNFTTSSSTQQQHQTVLSCIFQTMVQLGFGIIRTRNIDDTILWLQRIHSRLLKRYFGSYKESKNVSNNSCSLYTSTTRHPSYTYPPITSRNGLLLYEEYKANIELTRERGTKTVSRIFAAQLKQIPGMSVKRVNAITAEYPTPKSLFDAYSASSTAETMVENLPITNVPLPDGEIQNTRKKQSRLVRVGPKCSLELSYVFCSLPLHSASSSRTGNNEENILVVNTSPQMSATSTKSSLETITSSQNFSTWSSFMETNPVDSIDLASIRATTSILASNSIDGPIKEALQSGSDDDDVVEIIRPSY